MMNLIFLCIASFGLIGSEIPLTKEVMESKIVETPIYLYKILSQRHWDATHNRQVVALPAEDDSFIHLSTEEQLDKIIAKYWSDVPQFVALKIETAKLEGELVYEANPGGSTKYYHLYRGFIPFHSIAESKVVYRHAPGFTNTYKLDIVQVGDSTLRCPARALSKEEILSSEIQALIQEMKTTMRAAPGVGLAAPQIGRPIQLVVIEDMDLSHLTPEQLQERERYSVPFHVIINPRIYVEKGDKVEFFEGCLSVPGLIGIVPRARSVRIECLNERAEPVMIQAEGWYARILQHEIDHLNATLFIDRALLPTLMTEENYIKRWKGDKIEEIISQLCRE